MRKRHLKRFIFFGWLSWRVHVRIYSVVLVMDLFAACFHVEIPLTRLSDAIIGYEVSIVKRFLDTLDSCTALSPHVAIQTCLSVSHYLL